MGNVTKTISVYLESRDETVEIDVECEYEVQNNGIGSYECWGHRDYDSGSDYVEITNTEWDDSDFSEEEIKEINRRIDNKKEDWEEQIEIHKVYE